MSDAEREKLPIDPSPFQDLLDELEAALLTVESHLDTYASLSGNIRAEAVLNSVAGAEYTAAMARAKIALRRAPDSPEKTDAEQKIKQKETEYNDLLTKHVKKDIDPTNPASYPVEIQNVANEATQLESRLIIIDQRDPGFLDVTAAYNGATNVFEYLDVLRRQLELQFPFLSGTAVDDDQRKIQQIVQTVIFPRIEALRTRLIHRANEAFGRINPSLKGFETEIRAMRHDNWGTALTNLQRLAVISAQLGSPTAFVDLPRFERLGARERISGLTLDVARAMEEAQNVLASNWMNRILLPTGTTDAEPTFGVVNSLLALPAPSPQEAEERKKRLVAAEKSVWSGSDVVVSIPEVVVGARRIFPSNELINKYRQYVREQLLVLIENKKSEIDQLLKPESVAFWTVSQMVEKMEKILSPEDPLIVALYGAFHEKVGNEPDPVLRDVYKVRVALHMLSIYGDARATDFSIRFSKIIEIVGDKSEFIDYTRALFLKTPDVTIGLSPEEIDEYPVDTDAIEVVEYIIKRIKGKEKYGGIPPDATDPTDFDFSYGALVNEDRVGKFLAHLQTKFAPEAKGKLTDDEKKKQKKKIEKLSLLIKFAKNFGAKSAGYVPHLLRGATRGHGGIAADRAEFQSFDDELRYMAPYAFIVYAMTRYKNVETLKGSWLVSLMKQEDAAEVVRDADAGKDVVRGERKSKRIADLWDAMEDYYEADFGAVDVETFPAWLVDLREITGNKAEDDDVLLDINSTFFPTPVELITRVMSVQNEKNGLDPTNLSHDAAIRDFLNMQYKLGFSEINGDTPRRTPEEISKGVPDDQTAWFQKWKAIGQQLFASGKLTFDQYTTAKDATKLMFEMMDEDPKDRNAEESKAYFSEWLDKVCGKAKLVPGEHWLLFGPLTVRLMKQLVNRYIERDKLDQTTILIKEMCHEVRNANGLPKQLAEYVEHYVDEKNPANWMYDQLHPDMESRYLAHIWRWRAGDSAGSFGQQVAGALVSIWPERFAWMLTTTDGDPLAFVPPWYHAPAASHDASTSSSKSTAKH